MRRLLLACFLVACADPPNEGVASQSSKVAASRFDPSTPQYAQSKSWTCSVHTTWWMLAASGIDVSYQQVENRMTAANRVNAALGLLDANGPGVEATLRDFADGGPDIGHVDNYVTFDDVAARAGHMAVGIGGRKWNHWSAVRGYDPNRDVLLLANSARGWDSVFDEMTRGQFAQWGTFAMAWIDYGEAPSMTITERPTGGPFEALDVRFPVAEGEWITQCIGDAQRVWQTTNTGNDPSARWAEAKYPEDATHECGEAAEGAYPLVFRSELAEKLGGTWVAQCAGEGNVANVYKVTTTVDGHPAATFQYTQTDEGCP